MDLRYYISIFGAIIALILSLGLLGYSNLRKKQHPAIFIITLSFLASLIYCFFFWDSLDFINNTSPLTLISIFIGIIPIIVSHLLRLKTFWHYFFTIIPIGFIIFFSNIPTDIIPSLPAWGNHIICFLIWAYISLTFHIIAPKTTLASTETASTGLGIYILSLLKAIPFSFGFIALIFSVSSLALIIHNKKASKISIPKVDADCLGFILGGLFYLCATENAFSPVLIFMMLFICETGLALILKLSFLPQYKDLHNNTACSKAEQKGLLPPIINNLFARINILLVLMGCFQVYAPNQHSILLICFAITCWQMYRLINWNSLTSSIKETNLMVQQELKKNINRLKNNINNKNKAD